MWTNIYNLICYVSQKVNAYDKLNLDGYLTALGLYVAPDYRGDGIGLELLKARYVDAKILRIKKKIIANTTLCVRVYKCRN